MQIRTGMRSSWLAAAAAVLVTGLLALLPSGCGGGEKTIPGPAPTPVGATPTPTPLRTAAFKVKIDWGARSRVVGLSSAQSAKITLVDGDPAGGDITWVENRPTGTAAVLSTYTSPRPAKVGNFLLKVEFFGEPGAGIPRVGTAEASATILEDGSLTVTISTYTGIQTVEITPVGQSVAVGQTSRLAVTGKDVNGLIVPLTDGAKFFTVVANPENMEVADGGSAVKALHPTQATVTVRVDGAVSPPTVIRVTSGTAVTVPIPAEASNLGSEFELPLVATVTGAPAAESDVIWSVEGGEGTQNGTLEKVAPNSVTYVAPKLVGSEIRNITIVATSKYDPARTEAIFKIPVKVIAPAVVEMTPLTADLTWEQTIPISALVKNLTPRIPATGDSRREVTWELVKDGTNPVGSLIVDASDANKISYTAPRRDTVTTPATPILIRAISKYDSTKIGVCTITVASRVGVDINPKPAVGTSLNWEDTLDLTATVAQTPNQSVAWTVRSPAGFGGAIVGTGVNTARFTAPKNDGDYVIRATSNYDTRRFQDITIKVLSKTAVAINPNVIAPIQWEDTVDLTGVVTLAKVTSVTWSIQSPAGFASRLVATGATTARFTAPKVNGVYVIRATSDYDPRKFSEVSITVNTLISVGITSPDPLANPLKVSVRRTQSFSAALSGLPQGRDNTILWTITGPNGEPNTGNIYGTVQSPGATVIYSAPASVPGTTGNLRVIATSRYDTVATKTINVQVVAGSLGIGIK